MTKEGEQKKGRVLWITNLQIYTLKMKVAVALLFCLMSLLLSAAAQSLPQQFLSQPQALRRGRQFGFSLGTGGRGFGGGRFGRRGFGLGGGGGRGRGLVGGGRGRGIVGAGRGFAGGRRGFGGRRFGAGGVGGGGFRPTQNCVAAACQQNNQNIQFNAGIFG